MGLLKPINDFKFRRNLVSGHSILTKFAKSSGQFKWFFRFNKFNFCNDHLTNQWIFHASDQHIPDVLCLTDHFGRIDDRKAAGEILEAWWNSLWQWSQRAAVSGRGVDKCIFRELLK